MTTFFRRPSILLPLYALLVSLTATGYAQIPTGAVVLTADGDFGLQTNGSPVTTPWNPNDGQITAASGAQSPFTNTFANNNIGATVASVSPGTNPYIVGPLTTNILAASPVPFTVNVDFQNTTAGSGNGSYDFFITNSSNGNNRTGALYVSGNTLYMDHPGATVANSAVASLAVGAWYDAQLTFNPVSQTYTGTLTQSGGGTTQLPTMSYVQAGQSVNTIYSDSGSSSIIGLPGGAGVAQPAHNIDNFVVYQAVRSLNGSNGVVNIDFNGVRGSESPGVTFVGQGAGGGGTVFNGISADSRGGNDNLTVSAGHLLNSTGGLTNVGFTIGPVGGDNPGANGLPTNPSSLLGDYVFDHSAQNFSASPFTISGLGGNTSADLYFYASNGNIEVSDGHGGFLSELVTTTSLGRTLEFFNVPIIGSSITGIAGFDGNTAVISGLSIVGNGVPEPSSIALLSCALLGLAWTVRRQVRGCRLSAAGL